MRELTNPSRLQFTPIGTFFLNLFLNLMELICLAPKGSGKVRPTPHFGPALALALAQVQALT